MRELHDGSCLFLEGCTKEQEPVRHNSGVGHHGADHMNDIDIAA